MRVAVVGLGGVGGYIAANLTKTSHSRVGFARGEHIDQIKESGIKIVEDEESWSSKVYASELDEADGRFDVDLFWVKSYSTNTSYEAISKFISNNTIIVSFSNGVSNGDELKKLSSAQVLDGCVYILSHIEEPGVIRKKGNIFAAAFGGLDQESRTVKPSFDEAS